MTSIIHNSPAHALPTEEANKDIHDWFDAILAADARESNGQAHAPNSTQEVLPGVFKGRWGYYPCTRGDWLVIKRLAQYYRRAICAFKTWSRWKRKAPRNRCIWHAHKSLDIHGTGREFTRSHENMGPMPEPRLVAPLTSHFPIEETFEFHKKRGEATQLFIYGVGPDVILADYERARRPMDDPTVVQPLQCDMDYYRQLLADCEEWAAKNS